MRSLLRRLISAIAVMALAGFATQGYAQNASTPSVIVDPVLDASTVVTLDRGPCIGRCSEYAVMINGLGDVVFEGRKFVCARGRHTSRAPREEVRRLVVQMIEAGYFELSWPAGPITNDQPTVRSSLRHGRRVREIEHDLGDVLAPLWLRRLEERIDAIAGTSRWLPERENHRPMCNREDGVRLPLEDP